MINGSWRVMISSDGNYFITDSLGIYIKVRDSEGMYRMVLPVTLELSAEAIPPFTVAQEPAEPALTIPKELAKVLLNALATHFYGDNDGNSPGNLISRINRLTYELAEERRCFSKLLNALSNLSVMKVTDGNAVADDGTST